VTQHNDLGKGSNLDACTRDREGVGGGGQGGRGG